MNYDLAMLIKEKLYLKEIKASNKIFNNMIHTQYNPLWERKINDTDTSFYYFGIILNHIIINAKLSNFDSNS